MVVNIPEEDLPVVLRALKKQLPDSTAVYTVVTLISHGLSGYRVFVDRWPNFQAVLITPDEKAIKSPNHEKCSFLHCPETQILHDLFQQTGVLKQLQLSLIFLWQDVFKIAEKIILESVNPSFVLMGSGPADVYYADRVVQPPELPDGFSARKLTPDDAETVLTGVWYSKIDYCKSVRRVLEMGILSSVGVENKEGQLVAWTLQHIVGFLGMTFVKPEYRGKKLGKYVTSVLAQDMIERDGYCMAGIEDGNTISIQLHEGLGFKKYNRSFTSGAFLEKEAASATSSVIYEKNSG